MTGNTFQAVTCYWHEQLHLGCGFSLLLSWSHGLVLLKRGISSPASKPGSTVSWIRELGWKKTVWTEREGTGSLSVQKDQWEHQAGSKTFPCSSSLTRDQSSYNAQPHSKFRELSNSKAVSHVHYSSPAQEWAMLLEMLLYQRCALHPRGAHINCG